MRLHPGPLSRSKNPHSFLSFFHRRNEQEMRDSDALVKDERAECRHGCATNVQLLCACLQVKERADSAWHERINPRY